MNGRRLLFSLTMPLLFFSLIAAFQLWWIPSPDPVYATIRVAGILAYGSSFLAIVASASPRDITKLTGNPFLRVHHIFAISALALMMIHATATWISFGTPSVFLPELKSLRGFLMFGGRVSLPLFILTASTAKFSRSVPFWRKIHLLNYAAFFLVTTHALMIGTDFDSPTMRGLAYFMTAIAVMVPAARYFRKPRPSSP